MIVTELTTQFGDLWINLRHHTYEFITEFGDLQNKHNCRHNFTMLQKSILHRTNRGYNQEIATSPNYHEQNLKETPKKISLSQLSLFSKRKKRKKDKKRKEKKKKESPMLIR